MPKPHSTYNDDSLENALLEKARELIAPNDPSLSFIIISGNFYETRGFAYSAIRDWKGATKPSPNQRKKPILDATFACLSVYLGSLVSFQVDFMYAYEEIKKILIQNNREDLWAIIEEKLPFVSMPPQEMFPEKLKSPISPYYVIKQDQDMVFGELYPSVYLTNIVKSIKSRFFCFYTHNGYTAFAFFNLLPLEAKFGFEKSPQEFLVEPTSENIKEYLKNAKTLKDLFVALINTHNASLLSQFLIDDYEELINNLLEIDTYDSGGKSDD